MWKSLQSRQRNQQPNRSEIKAVWRCRGRGRNMVSIPKKKRNFQQYKVMLSKEVRRGLKYPLDFITGRPLVNLMKVLWVERGGGSLNGVNDE